MKIKASFHAFILYGFMQTIMSLQECPLQASSVLWCRGLHQLQPHTEVSVSVWNVVVVCYQTSVHLYWCVWVSLGSSSHFPSTCLTSQLGTTAVALYPGLLKRQMLGWEGLGTRLPQLYLTFIQIVVWWCSLTQTTACIYVCLHPNGCIQEKVKERFVVHDIAISLAHYIFNDIIYPGMGN